MFETEVLIPDFKDIVSAVPITLLMAVAVFVFSTAIGALFAYIDHKKIPILRQSVMIYSVVFKGVPKVIVIFLVYYSLPAIIQFVGRIFGYTLNGHSTPNWVVLIVSLIACMAAFQAEIIKGALNSFDTGQSDAARSLGYRSSQVFRRILFPQIVVSAIPDLATSIMVIMKALSLGFAIEVIDIFAQAQLTAALNFYYLEAFIVAVVIYMVLAYAVTQTADRLERSLRVW